jgi:hypothetical protein
VVEGNVGDPDACGGTRAVTKVLTPNDFAYLEAIIARLTAFEARLSENPKPIAWRFTRPKLLEKWSHNHDTNL